MDVGRPLEPDQRPPFCLPPGVLLSLPPRVPFSLNALLFQIAIILLRASSLSLLQLFFRLLPFAMAQQPNPSTLFHLVPSNDEAREALDHPDNRRFVSLDPTVVEPALEVGFHVSSVPGRVMARLGRNADLILQRRSVSAVHVSFEIHPETLVVLLSTRAKRVSSVLIKPVGQEQKGSAKGDNTIEGDEKTKVNDGAKGDDTVEGDCVLGYGVTYDIRIAGYHFFLVWRAMAPAALRELAIQEYNKAMKRQAIVRSRYLPTEGDSEAHTWHNTRIHTAQRPLFVEAKEIPRVEIGGGTFGKVYRVLDEMTGNTFAVKTINLRAYSDLEYARAAAHREIKTLQKIKHVCHVFSFSLPGRGVPWAPVDPAYRSILSSFSAMTSGTRAIPRF